MKEDKFQKALEGNYSDIAEALTGQHGFGNQLKQVIGSYTRPGNGFLGVREQALRQKIRNYDDQIAEKQRRLEQKQQAITEQFARLQGSLNNLQRQGQALSAAMPAGGGGNLVQQLLGG
jgi:flagellar capping protein FliD